MNPIVKSRDIRITFLILFMALNVLGYYFFFSLYKYNHNILYMQINIDGPYEGQGHNPKGH